VGTLYVVATPIGNLGDISERARETLSACPVVVAEDTRRTGLLLSKIGGSPRLISLTEHNVSRRVPVILAMLSEHDVGLVSDAGTPAISDPGTPLIAAAHAAGIPVRVIPGPSAIIAALSVSGLPATPFTFLGYAPRSRGETARWAREWLGSGQTVVFFDAPSRVGTTVQAIADDQPDAILVVSRELTKQFEQVSRGTAAEVAAKFQQGEIPARGEFVVVARGSTAGADIDVDARLRERLAAGDGPNQAARQVSAETGLPKSDLYKRALELKANQSV
jgi:16S rRNA (cytidine1402-2'-O)-methyltransferase